MSMSKVLNHLEAMQAMLDGDAVKDDKYLHCSSILKCHSGIDIRIVHIYKLDDLDNAPIKIVPLSDWCCDEGKSGKKFYKVPEQIDTEDAKDYLLDDYAMQVVNNNEIYTASVLTGYDGKENVFVIRWPGPEIICTIDEFPERFKHTKFTVWEG